MKLIVAGTFFTIALIIGGVALVGNFELEVPITSEVEGLEVSPAAYDIGKVSLNAGDVVREYEIKNTTQNVLKIKKIATSCMCTEAKVITQNGEFGSYGMEMAGDKNPTVNIEISAGETAKVVSVFDPAAHGPQGVGPIDRSIYLTFSDPVGIKELKFNGVVTN